MPAPVRDLVTRCGQVWHQSEIKEHSAHRQIGGDGEDVPDQRRTEVHPEPALVRVGNQPVEEPRAPDVDDRKQSRRHDREDGHRLGRAGHRRAPLGPEQKQDRRDERAGVRDADPEHEVGDVDAPEHRMRVAGDTEPGPSLMQERQQPDRAGDERQHQPGVVEGAGWPKRAQDVVVDLREAHRGVLRAPCFVSRDVRATFARVAARASLGTEYHPSCVTFFRYVTAGRVLSSLST